MTENTDVRLLALETLLEVEKKNCYVKDALHKQLFQQQFMEKKERAFLSRLVEGVTEYQIRLDYIINQFSKIKVRKCKPLIRAVLRLGVYQILYMDSVPNEVACNECVRLTKKKGFQNLSGYVNGVLRSICRGINQIKFPDEKKEPVRYLGVTYSMPEWLVESIIEWYGIQRAKMIMAASLHTSDLTVRVNTSLTSKKELIKQLSLKEIEVREGNYVPEALHLSNINYVNRIPGFKDGLFFVQDESSMLLYHMTGVDSLHKEGERLHILDLCAAPGGKSTHFAQELGEKAEIYACDVSDKKVSLIQENMERLKLSNMKTKVWDARVFDDEFDKWADVVIADLPCSGLGILAKKNDIKYHVSKQQLEDLVRLQQTILTNAVKYLRPGGVLLYSTCTINPSENVENAAWIERELALEKADIKNEVQDVLQDFMIDEHMLQMLPGMANCDGFFISKFMKPRID